MKFAKTVFAIAGVVGVLAIVPLYFLMDYAGRLTPPAVNHPELYYAFVGVVLVWQFAYLLIATDPARFRPMMLLAAMAKFSFAGTFAILYLLGRLGPVQLAAAAPDALLCVLFLISFQKAQPRRSTLDHVYRQAAQ